MIRKQLFVEMLWVGGIISSLAFGQVNRIQQGNLLDANNRVGSGGMNMIGQTYDFNAGNRIVSGNVVGGRAFRGYSPIRDSSSLFLGSPVNAGTRTSSGTALWGNNYYGSPVDRLNNFYRDSYSYSDQRPPFDTGRSDAYYSNIGNVANTGAIIQGLNRIGTPQLLNPNQSQQSSRLYTDQGYADVYGQNLGGTLVRADTGQPLTGRVNNRLLRSSLFAGAVRPTTAAELADETARLRESMGVLAYAQQRQAIGPIDLQGPSRWGRRILGLRIIPIWRSYPVISLVHLLIRYLIGRRLSKELPLEYPEAASCMGVPFLLDPIPDSR